MTQRPTMPEQSADDRGPAEAPEMAQKNPDDKPEGQMYLRLTAMAQCKLVQCLAGLILDRLSTTERDSSN